MLLRIQHHSRPFSTHLIVNHHQKSQLPTPPLPPLKLNTAIKQLNHTRHRQPRLLEYLALQGVEDRRIGGVDAPAGTFPEEGEAICCGALDEEDFRGAGGRGCGFGGLVGGEDDCADEEVGDCWV